MGFFKKLFGKNKKTKTVLGDVDMSKVAQEDKDKMENLFNDFQEEQNKPESKEEEETVSVELYEVQWGGYYASKEEDGTYSIFRLLDFNIDAYHSSLFEGKHEGLPTAQDIANDKMFIQHVPVAMAGFINRKPKLIAYKDLTKDDLEGYEYYRKEMGATDEQLKKLFTNIINFSKAPENGVRVGIHNGEFIHVPNQQLADYEPTNVPRI